MKLPLFYKDDLSALRASGRYRSLSLAAGWDFSSNDYLALAGSAELAGAARAAIDRGVPLGSGGSRLLRGNGEEHERLETAAAEFFGSECALFVGSGFAANTMLLATLPQKDDIVFYDELVHASAHEGMKLSRAPRAAFRHNDVQAAADAIRQWRESGNLGTPWIAFETLYSMDGDCAPLADFAALADRESAMLLIDEAHAVGVCGNRGRGLAADLQGRENAIVLATCGKALGCEGALVLVPETIRDFLINRGRSFIFSTAPSPLMAAVLHSALDIVAGADDRRERLRALVGTARKVFDPLGIAASGSHIQPIIIGDDRRTMELAKHLQHQGFDIRGIRPPTVPPGTARLRVSITLNTSAEAIAELGTILEDLL